MDFASEKAYISKKKLKNIQDHKVGTVLSAVKEKSNYQMIIDEEEKEVDKESQVIKIEAKKSLNRKIRSRSRSKERRRSRSNSVEKINDEELDAVYSDPEEVEGNNIAIMAPKQNNNNNRNLYAFSQQAPKKKKVLYQVSQMTNKEQVYEQEVDTNVFAIKFDFLKDKVAIATGDPIHCECEAVLSNVSQVEKIPNSAKSVWVCEFCGKKNEVFVEKEEIPQTDCTDYIMQSMTQLKGSKFNYSDDQTLIFCFDISGSMCVTYPLTGKHKVKGNNTDKYYKDLMKFSDGSDQFFGVGNKNVTYISRLQCLQGAIENNLTNLVKVSPFRKVGLVAFNNEIVGFGDGTKGPVKISGNNLEEFQHIQETAVKNQHIISTPIKDAFDSLMKQLYSLEESGQTALGPAVLFSLNLINGVSPGSRIILCTDGVANTGIGSMDAIKTPEEVQKLKDFYAALGASAKEKGVVIDLVTFEDVESNIEILTAMIEQTGGEISRVKPNDILEEFGNLLSNELVATNVKVKVKIHKLMQFRKEDQNDIKHEGCTLIKEVGNATKESELYIEYCFKNSKEIAKYVDIDLDSLKFVPFQSIIDYTNKIGDRCIRVVTKTQQLSSEKEVIQNAANYDIISTNAIQKTSKLAKDGKYREAQSNSLAWKKLIGSQAINSVNARQNYNALNSNMQNFNNNLQELQFNKLKADEEAINSGNNVESEKMMFNIKSDAICEQIHSYKNISSTKMKNNNSKKK